MRTVDGFSTIIRELGPYLILACGVLLALHGRATEGLITGGFALLQVGSRPTPPAQPGGQVTNSK